MVDSKAILDGVTAKMQRTVDHLEEVLIAIRAGRASVNVLNEVMVDYYGSSVPVNQVASVTVPDARTVLVQPWEKPLIPIIEKAILVANIGLTPSNNGEHIRLNIPALTEERRKELVKQAKSDVEDCRVSIRSIRREAVDAFKKAEKEGMPEDMARDGENDVQKITDKFSKMADEIFAKKEAEIMTV